MRDIRRKEMRLTVLILSSFFHCSNKYSLCSKGNLFSRTALLCCAFVCFQILIFLVFFTAHQCQVGWAPSVLRASSLMILGQVKPCFFFLQNEEHLEEGRILSPLSSQFRVLPT